jgi:hypothetical protein
MINLYNDFTLHYDFNTIDVFDIYDIFNNTFLYDFFPFANTQIEIEITHTNVNSNILKLKINNSTKYDIITNCCMIELYESIIQYKKKKLNDI